MKKRFWETEKMFRARLDRVAAAQAVGAKRLWRIDAIEMKKGQQGWTMGNMDHFTVEAFCEEMAIGVFKRRNDRMNWFVTDVKEEVVVG